MSNFVSKKTIDRAMPSTGESLTDFIGSLLQALVWQGTVAKILLPEDSIDWSNHPVVSGSTHPVVSHPAHNMGGCSGNESPIEIYENFTPEEMSGRVEEL